MERSGGTTLDPLLRQLACAVADAEERGWPVRALIVELTAGPAGREDSGLTEDLLPAGSAVLAGVHPGWHELAQVHVGSQPETAAARLLARLVGLPRLAG